MATAAKSRNDFAIEALQLNSCLMPPAKATGLTLPESFFPHLEEKWPCQF